MKPILTKINPIFERLSYIYQPVQFKKNQIKIWALIDFRNDINAITFIYVSKLGLKICFIDVRA